MLREAPKLAVQNIGKTKLLFGAGSVLVATTGVCAAKAAPVAVTRINDIRWDDMQIEETPSGHKLYRMKRYALEVAPLYLPAILAGGAAIACFGYSNKQLAMKAAASAAAAGMAERMLTSYSEKAMEELGEDAHNRIMQAVANDVPEAVMERSRGYLKDDDVANLYPHMAHDVLWYDCVMDKLFWSTESKILDAESKVNQQIIGEQAATIADFYAYMMLDSEGSASRALGWSQFDSHVNSLSIIFGSKLDPVTHIPINTIAYRWVPIYPREGSN